MTEGLVWHENIPAELKSLKQWCVWKDNKVPHSVDTGFPISSNKPGDWGSFEDAIVENDLGSAWKGVGFLFTDEDDYCGIDLDDCIVEGAVKPWAAKVLKLFNTGYIEYSPSGRGLHIIVKATKPGAQCKHTVLSKRGAVLGKIEIYDRLRYFTITGKLFDKSFVTPGLAQEGVDKLYNGIFAATVATPATVAPTRSSSVATVATSQVVEQKPAPIRLTREEIESLIKSSTQGGKYEALTSGSFEAAVSAYGGDHSSAEFALVSIVSWWTADFNICDSIFRSSPLYCGKWAPDTTKAGRTKIGKWAALGNADFTKCRRKYELAENYYMPEAGRSDPEEDFSEVTLTKEQKKGEAEYQRHIDLLLEYGEPRRDLFTETLHINNGSGWSPVFTKAFIGTLRGECQARGKAYKKSKLEDYLYRFENSLRKELLLDVPAWDGEDRIGFMCSRLKLRDVTKEIFTDIFKDWCAKMWQRIENPTKVQNLCILLSGEQGIGKDVWVGSIFQSLGKYFSDFMMDGKFSKESDIGIVMGKSLCMFISEFEKTEGLDIGTLKDLITRQTFTAVRKYDREASTLINRCSVIGACNPSHVFRDVTGNRRFLFFRLSGGPGEAITWDYPASNLEYSLRCISQIKALGEANYRASPDSWQVMRELQAEYTPEDPNVEILLDFEAAIESKAANDAMRNNHGLYRPHEVDDIIGNLAKNYGLPRKNITGILKRAGCQHRTAKCRWYGTRAAVAAGHDPDSDKPESWEGEFN